MSDHEPNLSTDRPAFGTVAQANALFRAHLHNAVPRTAMCRNNSAAGIPITVPVIVELPPGTRQYSPFHLAARNSIAPLPLPELRALAKQSLFT
ncbi:MAG: hypothetical protein V4724_35670 [Pseudomonadota bacterium]